MKADVNIQLKGQQSKRCNEHRLNHIVSTLTALEHRSGQKPCVAVEAFQSFWDAEEYHQDYYLKNPEAFRRELIESGRIKETPNF